MQQYYGINSDGDTVYVAMSKQGVVDYAEKHPDEDIVQVEDKSGNRCSLTSYKQALTECLKKWDRKEFRDNSNCYELQMLYESNKTSLSSQQKNELSRFIRQAKTAEEVNTYMTTMFNRDKNESLDEDIDEESFNRLKEIAYELDEYIEDKVWVRDFWFDGQFENTITFCIDGDWKHDHLRFEHYAKEWLDDKGLKYNMFENITDDDGSDSYEANHVIKIYNVLDEAFDKPPHEFWYYTKHGLGPGTVPKDVEILDVYEDDNWGTYIKLDKVLTTDELNYYELKEKVPEGLE